MVAIIPTVKEFFSAVEICGELITAEILFLSMFVKMLISGIIKKNKNMVIRKTFITFDFACLIFIRSFKIFTSRILTVS